MRGALFVFVTCAILTMQGWLIKGHIPPELLELPAATTTTTTTTVTAKPDAWYRTPGFPDAIETKFYRIAIFRRGAISQGGSTLVDADTPFNSVVDVLAYVPRALQLGVLSPLPALWQGEGSTAAMTLARKVMGFATCLFYVCLVGFCAALIKRWRELGIWIVLLFCLLGILVWAITYPNIGTLMRYRYGFYMVLISFGASALVTMFMDWRRGGRMKFPTRTKVEAR